ncbi:hypothetical protein Tco_0374215 [Tanacetum coccineum]
MKQVVGLYREEEIDKKELEAHYGFMAKIHEVLPAESSSTDTPLEKVQNHDENNVFANERQHSEKTFAEYRLLGGATDCRDSCPDYTSEQIIMSLRSTVAFNDRVTIDYEILQTKLNETLGLLALKDIEIKEGFEGKLKAYEISVLNPENYDEFSQKESIQTIHMLAPKCSTYNGRPTFANPRPRSQWQKASDYDNSDPVPPRQHVVPTAWIEVMQEELHQFNRLKVWELIDKPFGKMNIKAKWIMEETKRMKIRTLLACEQFRFSLPTAAQQVAQPEGFIDSRLSEKSLNTSEENFVWIKTSSKILGDEVLFRTTDPPVPKSTSGGIQFLGDKLVSWMSKKQNYTAMSSAEAEYVVLSASYA